MPLKDFLDQSLDDQPKLDPKDEELSDSLKKADRLFALAVADLDTRAYQDALQKLCRAYQIYVAERDPEGMSSTTINISIVFNKFAFHEEAKTILVHSINLCQDYGLTRLEIESQLALGKTLLQIGDKAQAKKCFDRANEVVNYMNDQELKFRVSVESRLPHVDFLIHEDAIMDKLSESDSLIEDD